MPIERKSAQDIILDHIRALVYGPPKSGKTEALRTLARPLMVYCFKSDEVNTLRGEPDIYYEVFQEMTPKTPTAFQRFNQHFSQFAKEDIFGPINAGEKPFWKSLAFDPLGGLQEIIMDFHMASVGAAGQVPLWERDFYPTKVTLGNILRTVTSLPLHFVLTAHSGTKENEITKKILGYPIVVGDMKETLGGMFDEVYRMLATTKQGKRAYAFMTQSDGVFPAGTRLGQRGLFNVFEKPDFSYLLDKAQKGGPPQSQIGTPEDAAEPEVPTTSTQTEKAEEA